MHRFLALVALTAAAAPPMQRVDRAMLCVTEGSIEEGPSQRLSVNATKMRAYVSRATSQNIAAQFTYLGPSAQVSKLGSGTTRIQFGLKLRAAYACNVVYAMWRFEPESRVVVSVKTNPDQHSSAECGNRGYRNIKPAHDWRVPTLRPGDRHMLRAEMNGQQLRVFVDGNAVWDGSVGPEAMRFDGPVGIRSDNARLEMELLAGPVPPSHGDPALCGSEPESD